MSVSKHLFTIVAATLALTACSAPLSLYHRAGVEVSRMQSDLLGCQVSGAQSVPVSQQVRREPPRYIPGPVYCRPDGSCYRRHGYYVPGAIYTVDVNAGLRDRVVDQCMADRNYLPVKLPACSADVKRNAPVGVTTVLPRLDPNSCVIRNDDKSWQIVTTR